MAAIVLYPSPGIGHLISMVELGKLIHHHNPCLSITILICTPPFNTGSTAPYIRHVTATSPSIKFRDLPDVPLSPLESYPSIGAARFDFLRLNASNVHDALLHLSLSLSSPVAAFVIDLFCTSALEIGLELNVPTFYFLTSGANCLACYLYTPTVHRNTNKSFKDLNTVLSFPGIPPIHSSDMPVTMLDRSLVTYPYWIYFLTQLPKSNGIIVNTFDSLEPRALKSILDGFNVPDSPTPPVFCVGPLIASNEKQESGERDGCLKWLDSQPSRSVVFLCFGSLGLFSKEQLNEIALGLERSGKRFLWVVRSPPLDQNTEKNSLLIPPEPELDILLPEGFLSRTKEIGYVAKSWAPQVAVLNHGSVGGFVTHCGWNSVLEAVCAGVPMIAWPLYAEQRLNKVFLVEELGLALPMDECEEGFVKADEVARRVGELMGTEEGGERVRARAEEAREGAREALGPDGSSLVALAKLVESWRLS